MSRLLLLLLTLCLALPGCWQKDCSKWPFMNVGDYWHKVRNGYGYQILETRAEYICLLVIDEHYARHYRVDRRFLTREVQEETYRLVVQRNIAWLKKALTRRATADPRRLVYIQHGIDATMRVLEDFTGLSFDNPDQWIRWWEENHDRLRLAPDGRHMVVAR